MTKTPHSQQKIKNILKSDIFNFNNQRRIITPIKKIIPEFFNITHKKKKKSKIKEITF